MTRYKCIKTVQYLGRVYNEGRLYDLEGSPSATFFEITIEDVTTPAINSAFMDMDETYYFGKNIKGWDDLRFPFTQARRGALAKPDFDYTNVGLLFPQDDDAEKIYLIAQFPHKYKIGTMLRPHIHWQQTGADFPVWKLDYKIVTNGIAVPSSFTTIQTNTGVFPYDSGNLGQISCFPSIAGLSGLSDFVLVKMYRDDNVVSGDVLAFEFDMHYQIDSIGSGQEYSK